ncbi:class I SAM-dependent methyltransferase [Amaricoccus sp.]|uniref:class I SAM-dependent DNA methyltransferase n=1 Tax=Amaricoccus sp. TaxID=1872485 RepID=UPI001B5F4181|nr:methyltransferase domain-containing protein [Amaricoccus sp.]MBP7001077.1 methyltransferase domain-containing protein [Amaricoccus sp.]
MTEKLDAVYGAASASEITRAYDDWAEGYEADMRRLGYRHPAIGLALLARHAPRGAAPVLDAGAGTGLVGEWLGLVGFPVADALDLSEGMLAVARRKGCYRALHRAALGGPLPFADGAYAAAIATGVFTTGHVGAEGLDALARAVRPGGVIVLTVKETIWPAFAARIAALGLALLDETPPYHSMPGSDDQVPTRAVALRVPGS